MVALAAGAPGAHFSETAWVSAGMSTASQSYKGLSLPSYLSLYLPEKLGASGECACLSYFLLLRQFCHHDQGNLPRKAFDLGAHGSRGYRVHDHQGRGDVSKQHAGAVAES